MITLEQGANYDFVSIGVDCRYHTHVCEIVAKSPDKELVVGELHHRSTGDSEDLVWEDESFQTGKMINHEDDYPFGDVLMAVDMDRCFE